MGADEEFQLKLINRQRAKEFQRLKVLFKEVDDDSSGIITENEFISAITFRDDIVDQLRLLGFHEREVPKLFHDLDNGDGELSFDEFVNGLRNMHGDAKAKDVTRALNSVERLHKRFDMLLDFLDPEGKISDPYLRKSVTRSVSLTQRGKAAPGQKRQTETGQRVEQCVASGAPLHDDAPELHHHHHHGSKNSEPDDHNGPVALERNWKNSSSKESAVPGIARHCTVVGEDERAAGAGREGGSAQNDTARPTITGEDKRYQSSDRGHLSLKQGAVLDGNAPDPHDTAGDVHRKVPGGLYVGPEILNTVFDEVRAQLKNQLGDFSAYLKQECSAELMGHWQEGHNHDSRSTRAIKFDSKGPNEPQPPEFDELEMRKLVLDLLCNIKAQVACICRAELAHHVRGTTAVTPGMPTSVVIKCSQE